MPAIVLSGLTKRFGQLTAVDGIHLEVPSGSVFGFLGPNGAGKTTTLHLLLGILAPTSGSAVVADVDVAVNPEGVRRRCGALLEHNGLYERLSARDNLEFHGRLFGLAPAERAERTREVLDRIGLWERRNELVGTWSKGMKQQLAIGRALLHRPDIVFLDEPTNGFDPAAAKQLRDQMREMARDGTTVFLTTHNLPEVEAVCDRVAVIRNGRLLAVGEPGHLAGEGNAVIEVEAANVSAKQLAALRKRKELLSCESMAGGLRLTMAPDSKLHPVVAALVEAGVQVGEVRRIRQSLEKEFLELVGAP